MLKCFSVITVVIPGKAEGPDRAFNCVCHAVRRGGRARASPRGATAPAPLGSGRGRAARPGQEGPGRRGRAGAGGARQPSPPQPWAAPFGWAGRAPPPRGAPGGQGRAVPRPPAELLRGAPLVLFLSVLNETIHRAASRASASPGCIWLQGRSKFCYFSCFPFTSIISLFMRSFREVVWNYYFNHQLNPDLVSMLRKSSQ